MAHSGSEELLADRIVNAEQYTPLLSEPFTESEETDGGTHNIDSDTIKF